MSIAKSQQEIIQHKDDALKKLDLLLTTQINNSEEKKADLLSYWIEDYCSYLSFEDKFNPAMLKKYKRGDIIKVNLGFRIGNEHGGLHYCVVLDKKNIPSTPLLTVVPLSSIKPNKPINFTSVFLGTDLFDKMQEKYAICNTSVQKRLFELNSLQQKGAEIEPNYLQKEISEINNDLLILKKIYTELMRMKSGSIALVNQITTISKQRIVNPQKNTDVLSGIRLSEDKLALIDKKINDLFLKNCIN